MKKVNPRLPLPFENVRRIMKQSAEDMKITRDAVELMIECVVDYIRQKTYKSREITKECKMRTIKKRHLELAL
jgi:histone H3/H4